MTRFATRSILLALLASVGLACSSPLPKSDDATEEVPITACAEPRRHACTMEYIPVCGQRYDGEHQTYPNACSACSDSEVSGHRPGPCEPPAPEADDPSDGSER